MAEELKIYDVKNSAEFKQFYSRPHLIIDGKREQWYKSPEYIAYNKRVNKEYRKYIKKIMMKCDCSDNSYRKTYINEHKKTFKHQQYLKQHPDCKIVVDYVQHDLDSEDDF
jgi:hypothetical protein